MSDSLDGGSKSANRFTILHLHAQGGLGQVSLARDEKLNRQVALKEIRPDRRDRRGMRQRFLREAEITGQLEHPGIVPIYDLDQDADGQVRYAMRFVQGRTLRDAILEYHDKPTPLAFRGLLQRFVSVCETIAYAHSQEIIHRDLKPANVLLGDYGETLVVDWGLAKRLAPPTAGADSTASTIPAEGSLDETTDYVETPDDPDSLSQAGHVLGTPAYMSPEQADGNIEETRAPADIYGLGAVLYELLTGQLPYRGKTAAEALIAVRRGELEPPTQVRKGAPKALEAICLKAMARKPSERYASATDLARDVERWLADEPVAAYREPLRVRFARWRRRNRTVAIAVAVLLLTGLVVGGLGIRLAGRERERTEALGRIDSLREATPASVPILVSALDANNDDVRARLRQIWDESDLKPSERRRIGLAMLRVDPPAARDRLLASMLDTDDPAEFLMLRDGMAAHIGDSVPDLWAEARRPETTDTDRFQLLVTLAAIDPDSSNWPGVADRLTEQLLATNSLQLGPWSAALTPIRGQLISPLRKVARADRTTEKGVTAATILTQYAADRPELMADLLLDASPRQFEVLWPKSPAFRTVRAVAERELTLTVPKDAVDSTKDELASRQANAAIALMRLGNATPVWPLLRASPEPRLRTYLIHRFAALKADPTQLMWRLWDEKDASTRQALLLSLGEYTSDRLSAVRQELVGIGLEAFRDDPDPGVHSAADWMLRKLGQHEALARAEKVLMATAPERQWIIAPEGHTMAVLPAPMTFPMSNYQKAGDSFKETIRTQKLPYSLGVATRKVTLVQFRRFLKDHPDRLYQYAQPEGNDSDHPAVQVTWIQAARYCRWLSEKAQFPETQMCFPEFKLIKDGMKLPADYAKRTGYRLPTSAEWECCCRAGSTTRFTFGSDPAMLDYFSWHGANSKRQLQPVAMLKPNNLGLFDIHGLAFEWTANEIYYSKDEQEWIYRGSSRFHEVEDHAISQPGVTANRPNFVDNQMGMRIVRTMPGEMGK